MTTAASIESRSKYSNLELADASGTLRTIFGMVSTLEEVDTVNLDDTSYVGARGVRRGALLEDTSFNLTGYVNYESRGIWDLVFRSDRRIPRDFKLTLNPDAGGVANQEKTVKVFIGEARTNSVKEGTFTYSLTLTQAEEPTTPNYANA